MKAVVVFGAAALTLVAVTQGHNVVRYVWLNYGQEPKDWVPLIQHLPRVRSVGWRDDYANVNAGRFGDRLLMLQSYTKNIAAYAELSAQINKKYCDRHGYDFKANVFDAPVSDRNPCWNKVADVSREVAVPGKHEWIFWVDSDAAVSFPQRVIEQIAAAAPASTDIFICTSIYLTKNVNTGAVLFRVTPWLQEFLDRWWNWPNKRWRQKLCHEQSALDEMMAKDVLQICTKQKVALFGCTEFNSTYQHSLRVKGKFIQHYRGCSTEKRVRAFKELLLRA